MPAVSDGTLSTDYSHEKFTLHGVVWVSPWQPAGVTSNSTDSKTNCVVTMGGVLWLFNERW